MRTIQSMWESFASSVLPPKCSDVQRTEMRKAFYGGAGAMLLMTTEISDIDNETSAVAVLRGLHEEFAAFAADIS